MVGLAPKLVRLAPNGTNPGLFQITFQCIWRIGPKWNKSGTFLFRSDFSIFGFVENKSRICSIWGKSDPFRGQLWYTWYIYAVVSPVWLSDTDIRQGTQPHKCIQIGWDWPQMGQIWDFSKISFSIFWLNVLKLILKSLRCVPFEANLTQLGCQIRYPWTRRELSLLVCDTRLSVCL